jgi:LysM repeat protein
MTARRVLQSVVILTTLALCFTTTGSALAWSGCGNYVTVQWGDTLSSIAANCGMSVGAIQAANPGLGMWVYAGQVLYMPGYSSYQSSYQPSYYAPQTGGSTYVVQWGDTLGDIAARMGVSLGALLAVNPQIGNASLIYPGQVINLPTNYTGSNYNSPLTLTYPFGSNPNNYYQNNYYPYNYYQPTPYPGYSSGFGNLKVTFGHGLLVRAGPGKNYAEILSPFVSAVKNSTWQYRKNSLTTDSTGLVWVEVALSPLVSGYSTGWIMVRDSIGNFFTDPKLGSPIDPNDP